MQQQSQSQSQYQGPERRQSQSQYPGEERRGADPVQAPRGDEPASSLPGMSSQERGPGHDERIRHQQDDTH